MKKEEASLVDDSRARESGKEQTRSVPSADGHSCIAPVAVMKPSLGLPSKPVVSTFFELAPVRRIPTVKVSVPESVMQIVESSHKAIVLPIKILHQCIQGGDSRDVITRPMIELQGVTYYRSSGTSSLHEGTWYPTIGIDFLGFIDKPYGCFPEGWVEDDEIGRFGTIRTLVVSAILGHGLWDDHAASCCLPLGSPFRSHLSDADQYKDKKIKVSYSDLRKLLFAHFNIGLQVPQFQFQKNEATIVFDISGEDRSKWPHPPIVMNDLDAFIATKLSDTLVELGVSSMAKVVPRPSI